MEDKRVIDRLLEYLRYKGISNSAAEKEMGLANAYLKNTSKDGRIGSIGSDILAKVEEIYLDLCLIWLITGKGDMLKESVVNDSSTPSVKAQKGNSIQVDFTDTPLLMEEHHANYGENVSPTKGKTVSPTVSPTLNLGMPHVITIDIKGRENVVLVPVRARAGYLNGYGDSEYIQSLPVYTLPGLRNGTFRAFETDGHSMSPTLKNHDIVIGEWVDSIDHITDDRIYIIVTKTKGIVVKRVLNRVSKYGFLVCKSDSITNRSEYPNLQIYPDDIKELWYARMKLSSDLSAPTDAWQRLNDLEATFEHFKNELKMLKG